MGWELVSAASQLPVTWSLEGLVVEGDEGRLPAHIWCFVELSNMPKGKDKLHFGGVQLQVGVCAMVESAVYNEDVSLQTQSDLFTPLLLDVNSDAEGEVLGRNFLPCQHNCLC